MKKLLAALVTACVAGTALFAIPALAATKSIALKDDKFVPKSVTVKRGTTVKFVWRGKHQHNLAETKAPKGAKKIKTTALKTKGSLSTKLVKKGAYTFICQVHPGMQVKIKVK
jgi:plastocyanin